MFPVLCWDLPKSSDVVDLVHYIRCSCDSADPALFTFEIAQSLTTMSTNRDVSLIIMIRSLPPSTKDVLEGGRERVLGTN